MTLKDQVTVVDVLDLAAAKVSTAAAARSAAALEQASSEEGLTFSAPGQKPVKVSSPLARMVATILRELAEGHTVAVVTTAEEVSTGVAARMLGFSRTHVANLVDAGILPGRRANKHRRIRLADVLAFQRERERRQELLDEITELTQDLYEATMPQQET
jgi:hypothetical protein